MAELHFLELQGVPILEQLRIEEALLRADERSWCIVNRGSPPAIVMGISGKLEGLDLDQVKQHNIPIIKRFSGGGTVVVDSDTLFVTFLGHKELLDCPLFPEPVMRWAGKLYQEAFQIPDFGLRERDFVIGERKCGGNAQYLRKERWLHHTSFLWDYCPDRMRCLRMPKRTPSYRQGRPHLDFLTPLQYHHPCPKALIANLKAILARQFALVDMPQASVYQLLRSPHRQTTRLIPLI